MQKQEKGKCEGDDDVQKENVGRERDSNPRKVTNNN